MKAVIYARFSTANQSETSIEDQERRCRRFAEARDLQIGEVYSDAAISGTHVMRPGLQKLLADAKARRFKVVVIDDIDRLSRDAIGPIQLARQLEDCGVIVWDVATGMKSDDPNALMIYMMKGLTGSQQVKSSGENTWRGLEGLALAGYSTGGRTYGYSSQPVVVGREVRHQLTIDPNQAEVVRRIFELALAGTSPRGITAQLNADGIPAPHDDGLGNKKGRGWTHTTIRAMLKNRRYIGEVRWNATAWKKKGMERHLRRCETRPEKEHVVRHAPELAIIDQATFDRISSRYSARKPGRTGRPKGTGIARHMLSGLLTCGVCGGTFSIVHTRKVNGVSERTLGCMSRKDRGPAICANAKTIAEKKVVSALVSHLRSRLGDADRLKTFIETFKAKFDQLQAGDVDPTAELQGKIDRQRQVVANATRALVTLPNSKAVGAVLETEEKALADLEAQLQQVHRFRPTIIPHPAAIARYMTELAATLEAGDLSQAGNALRTALAPFLMHPEAIGYRMAGSINLGVTEKVSSGGPLVRSSDSWAALELVAA